LGLSPKPQNPKPQNPYDNEMIIIIDYKDLFGLK
jgi:hypothetical protein